MKLFLIVGFAILATVCAEYSSEYQVPINHQAVEEISYQAPSNEYLAPIAAATPVAEIASGVLADDGYRYKTIRRLRHRHRRDVSELTQYLPPNQEVPSNQYLAPSNEYLAPSNEYLAPIAPVALSGALADDGYRYKAVRRLRRLRHRRDVSELPSAQYLPPVEQAEVPIEYLPPSIEQNANVLTNDGYRYKTVRRFKVRRH